jgi:hypothetical protein
MLLKHDTFKAKFQIYSMQIREQDDEQKSDGCDWFDAAGLNSSGFWSSSGFLGSSGSFRCSSSPYSSGDYGWHFGVLVTQIRLTCTFIMIINLFTANRKVSVGD